MVEMYPSEALNTAMMSAEHWEREARAAQAGLASLSSQHAEAVARVEALEEALAATFRRHFEGNDVERFERAAEEFRRVTGMLAPGKDAPAAGGNTPSREERQRAWDEWCDRRWRESVERLRTLLAQRAARGEAAQ